MYHHLIARGSSLVLCMALLSAAAAASREVSPGMPLVIPIGNVIGGTDSKNNAKNNPNGGYFSVYDTINEFRYPATHGNQLGNTALVNDHVYWDSAPGGLDHTRVPGPDAGGGPALWWPIPGEWAAYQFTVTTPGAYTVLTRFSSSWGPGQAAHLSLSIDGVSSGPIALTPDDPKLWSDTRYQVGGWWGHTMVSGTSPVGWTLGIGTHVLKVQMEKFPEKPTDHGNVWIRYFKISAVADSAKAPVTVLKPVVPRQVAAAANAFKQAVDHEQKGRLGQALVAYDKAAAGSAPESEQLARATAKAQELRALGESRLAAAKTMPTTEAAVALARVAEEFSGSDIATAANQAAAAVAAPSTRAVTSTWTPPSREQATATLQALIIATVSKEPIETQVTLFGKPQKVVVNGGNERAVTVKLAGSSAGLDLRWEQWSLVDLAGLGRSCVRGRANSALSVGESCLAFDLPELAEETLRLAARLDPTLSAAVAERLGTLSRR